jgi:hypothetical protein
MVAVIKKLMEVWRVEVDVEVEVEVGVGVGVVELKLVSGFR